MLIFRELCVFLLQLMLLFNLHPAFLFSSSVRYMHSKPSLVALRFSVSVFSSAFRSEVWEPEWGIIPEEKGRLIRRDGRSC